MLFANGVSLGKFAKTVALRVFVSAPLLRGRRCAKRTLAPFRGEQYSSFGRDPTERPTCSCAHIGTNGGDGELRVANAYGSHRVAY